MRDCISNIKLSLLSSPSISLGQPLEKALPKLGYQKNKAILPEMLNDQVDHIPLCMAPLYTMDSSRK